MKKGLLTIIIVFFTFNGFSQGNIESSEMDSSLIKLIIDLGKTYEGVPYKYGGYSSSGGFDCSGFLNYIFKMGGLELPRSSKEMYSLGTESDLINVKIGDFIFFNTLDKGTVSHVGLISNVDKEKIIMLHVSSSKGVEEIDIINSSYWYSRLVAVKSFFN